MRKLAMMGVAIATLAVAQSASAATTVDSCGSGSSCVINFDGISGTFGNANVTNTPFIDRYLFDLGAGLLSFTLTSTFTGADGGPQDIDFNLVRINAQGAGGVTNVPLSPGTDEYYSIRNLSVAAGQYALRLGGSGGSNLNASYSGTLNFSPAAVPEPATWAMMILGMGAVGFAMRRRRAVKTTVSYA
jgi:hypothetical protein